MNKTALVIPCYNCADQVILILESLSKYDWLLVDKILIVDNQSQDSEVLKIKNYLNVYKSNFQIHFYQNRENLGLGASFKRSLIYLKKQGFDKMIFLHGDNQAELIDYEKFQSDENIILFGSRFMRESVHINYSLRRSIVNRILNLVMTIIFKREITEIGSGLNVFPLKLIDKNKVMSLSNHIAFDLEFLIFCLRDKIPYKFFPISWKSEKEKSTISELDVGITLLGIILKFGVMGIRPKCDSDFLIEEGWKLIE